MIATSRSTAFNLEFAGRFTTEVFEPLAEGESVEDRRSAAEDTIGLSLVRRRAAQVQ